MTSLLAVYHLGQCAAISVSVASLPRSLAAISHSVSPAPTVTTMLSSFVWLIGLAMRPGDAGGAAGFHQGLTDWDSPDEAGARLKYGETALLWSDADWDTLSVPDTGGAALAATGTARRFRPITAVASRFMNAGLQAKDAAASLVCPAR